MSPPPPTPPPNTHNGATEVCSLASSSGSIQRSEAPRPPILFRAVPVQGTQWACSRDGSMGPVTRHAGSATSGLQQLWGAPSFWGCVEFSVNCLLPGLPPSPPPSWGDGSCGKRTERAVWRSDTSWSVGQHTFCSHISFSWSCHSPRRCLESRNCSQRGALLKAAAGAGETVFPHWEIPCSLTALRQDKGFS